VEDVEPVEEVGAAAEVAAVDEVEAAALDAAVDPLAACATTGEAVAATTPEDEEPSEGVSFDAAAGALSPRPEPPREPPACRSA
jgi:hypothetical protein